VEQQSTLLLKVTLYKRIRDNLMLVLSVFKKEVVQETQQNA